MAFGANGSLYSNSFSNGASCSNATFGDPTPGTVKSCFYSPTGASIHFEHADWLGTERARTSSSGVVEATFSTLPFGDGMAATGTDTNPSHFAGTDADLNANSNLNHATFREYTATAGRWMSPDPYSGSYDQENPQSLNRYSYVLNSPYRYTDPSGLDCGMKTEVVTWAHAADVYGDCGEGGGGGGGGGGANPCAYSACVTADPPVGPTDPGVPVYLPSPGPVSGPPQTPNSGRRCIANCGKQAPNDPNKGKQSKPTDWNKIGSCLASSTLDHYGLTGVTGLSSLLAVPISKSLVPPYRMIGTPTTNLFSVLGHYAEITVPKITIDGLASTNLLRIAGRANPYVAAGLFAVDAGMIGYGTYQCYQSP